MKIEYFCSYQRILHRTPLQYDFSSNKGYHRCFAHKFAVMNRYKMYCPFDFDFTISPKEDGDFVLKYNDTVTKNLFDNNILRFQTGYEFQTNLSKPILQIPTGFTFYSKQNCIIDQQQPSSLNKNLKFIHGKYDINSWIRPLSSSFEIQKSHVNIKFTRNDFLCEVIFNPDKINQKVVLVENKNPEQKLIDFSQQNTEAGMYVKSVRNLYNNSKDTIKKYFNWRY
jgi:hypothetical protein